jgi:hypothetical protein
VFAFAPELPPLFTPPVLALPPFEAPLPTPLPTVLPEVDAVAEPLSALWLQLRPCFWQVSALPPEALDELSTTVGALPPLPPSPPIAKPPLETAALAAIPPWLTDDVCDAAWVGT